MMARVVCVLLMALLASCGSDEPQKVDKPIPPDDTMILVGHVYCKPVLRDWCDVSKPCNLKKTPPSLATIVSVDGSVQLVTPGGRPFHFERGRFLPLKEKVKYRGEVKNVEQWMPSPKGDYLLAADPCAEEVYILHFPLPNSGAQTEGTKEVRAEEENLPFPTEWVSGTLECFDPARE